MPGMPPPPMLPGGIALPTFGGGAQSAEARRKQREAQEVRARELGLLAHRPELAPLGRTKKLHWRKVSLKSVIDDAESHALADAFVSADFLRRQAKFLKSKGKTLDALVFTTLVATRPLWAMLL